MHMWIILHFEECHPVDYMRFGKGTNPSVLDEV